MNEELRDKTVEEMVLTVMGSTGLVYEGDVALVAEILYANGYRKFEIVEEDV